MNETLKTNLSYFKTHPLIIVFLLISFLCAFGFDQYSKYKMHSTLLSWEDPNNSSLYTGSKQNVFIIGTKDPDNANNSPFFELNYQYSRNKGAAFSFLANLKDNIRIPLFYLITFIAVILIVHSFLALPLAYYITRFGLIMILAGALGNCTDRIIRGYVVDFISCNWNILGWRHNFAIFNIADVCINIGLACLIIDMILRRNIKLDTKKVPTDTDTNE